MLRVEAVTGADTALVRLAGRCRGERDKRHVRLTVTPDADPGVVLRAARVAGPLLSFDFQPPSLEEMFREAVRR